mgnify:CR=1 FL=1
MKKKKYKYLDPLFIRFPGGKLFEKRAGKKDAQENQLCELEGGYITPEIDTKVNSYDSHINKIFLKTAQELEPMIREANSMVIELNLLLSYKDSVIGGDGEEARRQAAIAGAKSVKVSERKSEILTRLASIKAESDMVDEMLLHYEERAEGILHSRISKYWRGVLSASSERLEHFPYVSHKDSPGRKAYLENRKKLVDMIESAISYGGGIHNEEEYEEELCG